MDFILSKLYKQNKVKALLKPFTFSSDPGRDRELRADFESEIYLILLEYPDRKQLRRLYKKRELDRFILGIIKRNFMLGNSLLYKKYKNYENSRTDLDVEDERFIVKNNLFYNEPYAYI